MEKQEDVKINKSIVSIIELFLGNEYDNMEQICGILQQKKYKLFRYFTYKVLHSITNLDKKTGWCFESLSVFI